MMNRDEMIDTFYDMHYNTDPKAEDKVDWLIKQNIGMIDNKKEIGGIPLDKWKRAFADAVSIAIQKDYFSDIFFFDLYPNINEEINKIWYEDTSDVAKEEAVQDLYEEKWGYVNEAFNEIFGFKR